MTNGDWQTRIAALEAEVQEIRELLQQTAQLQQQTQQQLQTTLDIANSNARSIAAWEALIEQNKVEAGEERSRIQVQINELIRANQQNTIDHELFRRRFEAIDPLTDEPG